MRGRDTHRGCIKRTRALASNRGVVQLYRHVVYAGSAERFTLAVI